MISAPFLVVQPVTVLAWHREGFQLYWRWKFRRRSACRPPLDLELRTLIRRMARENPTSGRRRIQAELRFLGYEVAELTVAKSMGHAPWQNLFAERVIGSIRRECLDHVIVINERHVRRLLRRYRAYYSATRPHQYLHNDSAHPHEVQKPAGGRIVAILQVGGLHHRYQRGA